MTDTATLISVRFSCKMPSSIARRVGCIVHGANAEILPCSTVHDISLFQINLASDRVLSEKRGFSRDNNVYPKESPSRWWSFQPTRHLRTHSLAKSYLGNEVRAARV